MIMKRNIKDKIKNINMCKISIKGALCKNLCLLEFILKHKCMNSRNGIPLIFHRFELNCDTLKDICLSLPPEGVFLSLVKGVPLKDAAECHYGKCDKCDRR